MAGPHLSLVVALRNEQYGGDLFGRMRSFLRNVAWLSRRQRVRAEVILVEWCPLASEPPLAEILGDSGSGGSLPVRIIRVPWETASSRFEDADEMILWTFTAKNVGVRRARSAFILATNADILFTPALFRAIGKRPLDNGTFYRAHRYDVEGVPLGASARAQLARCRDSVVRVNLLGGSVRFDGPTRGRALAKAVRSYVSQQRAAQPISAESRASRPTEWIHTNAAGDFFLAHSSIWEELRGYPEFGSAGQLDGYICVMAASAGFEQVVFDGRRRIYHLEHPRAVDWERGDKPQHYVVPFPTFLEAASEMLLSGRPTIFNDGSWGLADIDLPETTLWWDDDQRNPADLAS
jgi:hypothetical protein